MLAGGRGIRAPDISETTIECCRSLLEKILEGASSIVRSDDSSALARRQIAHDLRSEESAVVARALSGDAGRDGLTALPGSGRIEVFAVAAGVQVGAALTDRLGRQLPQSMLQSAALIAFESLGPETTCGAAPGPPSNRSFCGSGRGWSERGLFLSKPPLS